MKHQNRYLYTSHKSTIKTMTPDSIIHVPGLWGRPQDPDFHQVSQLILPWLTPLTIVRRSRQPRFLIPRARHSRFLIPTWSSLNQYLNCVPPFQLRWEINSPKVVGATRLKSWCCWSIFLLKSWQRRFLLVSISFRHSGNYGSILTVSAIIFSWLNSPYTQVCPCPISLCSSAIVVNLVFLLLFDYLC